MLELYALKSIQSEPTNKKEKNEREVTDTAVLFFYFAFLAFAISRALKCSSKTPDSRAIHFLFVFTSPLLYVISSYAVPGFYKK